MCLGHGGLQSANPRDIMDLDVDISSYFFPIVYCDHGCAFEVVCPQTR